MPSVGDFFDPIIEQVRSTLLNGDWDERILEDKERVAEELFNRYCIQEIEFDGDPEPEIADVERSRAGWEGEPPIRFKAQALVVKQKIKPNKAAASLFNVPAGSSLNAKGDVKYKDGYLSITLHGDDWNEEYTAKQLQYGKSEIANQTNRRNQDIQMGQQRVRDKINEIISAREPQLRANQEQKNKLADNLKKLGGK